MLAATIIVVAVMTVLIFVLALVTFTSFLKTEKLELASGKRDEELRVKLAKEKKKSSKVLNIIANIISGLFALGLLTAAATGVTYRASHQQFAVNNHVALVIVSDSMNGFYDSNYELNLKNEKPDATEQQFKIGDILVFNIISAEDELIPYDVYGYATKNGKVITHRYIGVNNNGQLIFRGDNTPGRDSYVNRDQVKFHYTEKRISHIGMFVLFSQSGFGLYSFISVALVYVLYDIFEHKTNKLEKERLATIKALEDLPKIKHTNLKRITIKFKTRVETHEEN